MTDLATYAGQRVPVLSHALAEIVSGSNITFFGQRETASEREARLKRGEPAKGMVIATGSRVQPSAAVIAEAKRVLPALERAFAPLSPERLRAEIDHFLDMLNASVANPQDMDALAMRKAALEILLEGAPAVVWSHDTLRKAQRQFKFFPSVAEVSKLLDEVAGQMRDKVAHVRMLSQQRAPEPERPRPSEAERKAVREMVAGLWAETKEREAHEAKIRKHGTYTPSGADGLTGWALLDALKADLPNLAGDLLAVTQERVEEMQRRFEAAERFMTSEAQA
ncbi:hypothetical protein [Asaia bogorensis]|uniref:hypothetical protein n=1 Tax=Asaia bogorensis TaxID=91915 RepID=UPI00286200FD|nr:hypothetical protein [Asaia bogorensis]MDR6182022.1 hypothetical protein [Asaia bogorensis NBRC 16594]